MAQGFRLPEILEIARTEGRVTVDGLAARFGVTAQTIRRDLAELDEAGQLERVHGGAILRSGTVNIGYQERAALNAEEKRAIARACAAEIPEGASIFLAIGTTTEAVARELRRHAGLMVVTNNMNVANILAENPHCQVIVTGGTLRRSDGGLTGPLTEAAIRQFKVDIAVIGCSALDAEGDMLDYDIQEVGVSQSLIAQARRAWLVTDNSKLARTAPARIGSLSILDTVFTDRPLPAPLMARCAQWQTRVVAG
ncbi:DeoR/GlpR family DNA-binding transcription regulator [Pararhodobacter aggregans]|uniref:DeoR family transcriptional regulator n=1 Tax=Pararhodobacter aggregans TaxID=404875 RepID=A0A2T7UV73_9RHOB|nr:DeoR/GlpR family DNA-binding transcription regulator [Pararhodobacter aggregans]PTX03896.1 DeoR family transcriptional regulator [Pararhodobacter aggregans]PVE48627.1 DeoR family transcriptional regulator [Pararhodobacter aggregans]